MEAVIGYLDEQDPDAAARARARYECLQPYAAESAEYGRAVLLGVGEPCRRRVVEQLVELRRRAGDYLRRDGLAAEDEYFFAEQNAAVVANAEEYYRTMFGDQAGSWNLRDRHMADTLDQLLAHLDRHGGTARSWCGSTTRTSATRAPQRWAQRGELNIGQLMRERHGRDAVNVGFTTYTGHRHRGLGVGRPGRAQARPPRAAGQLRGAVARHRDPRLPALPARRRATPAARLREPRLERAIGVIYRPQTERQSHWFAASAAQQFDALVHIDHTRAVEPLERTQAWELGEPPETYPTAL